MARIARIKTAHSKYHIMVRSLKELDLFKKKEDKIKYLTLVKKYQLKYNFKVYAYCLMSNHGHIIIDSHGSDISQIMHGINLSYAHYFNKKYDRYGPVFQDRFKSKIVHDERYMITLSAYIHNNPKDIAKYKNNIAGYPFSSLKEYINRSNTFGILTRSFLTDLIKSKNKKFKTWYLNLVRVSINEDTEIDIEFLDTKSEYQAHKTIIPKSYNPSEVISYVAKLLNQDPNNIYIKYRRASTKFRALSCLLMSYFCNISHKEICEVIGNMTLSGISYLTSKGIDIIAKEKHIINNFILQ